MSHPLSDMSMEDYLDKNHCSRCGRLSHWLEDYICLACRKPLKSFKSRPSTPKPATGQLQIFIWSDGSWMFDPKIVDYYHTYPDFLRVNIPEDMPITAINELIKAFLKETL